VRNQICGARKRKKREKVESFEDLKLFQVSEESAEVQEEVICTVRSGEKSRQSSDLARSEEVTTRFPRCKPRILGTVGCSHRYPSAIGSDRRCTGFNPSHARQKC
jgi:hypothetical protein